MRILALDYGSARCGAAICDPTGTIVRPLPPIKPPTPEAIEQLATEQSAELLLVGLPIGLSGQEGPQATETREFCDQLAQHLSIPIETYDERFTTRLAQQSAHQGATASEDSLAAAHLLESYLASRQDIEPGPQPA